MQAFETFVRVRYAETDAMGIVHHSYYFVWLELARIEWLRVSGIDYKEMEKAGFFLPVVQANLNYKLPVFFDDCIRIILHPPSDYQRARLTIFYELFREALMVAKGFTAHAFVNVHRKLVKPPAFFLEKFS